MTSTKKNKQKLHLDKQKWILDHIDDIIKSLS